MGDRTLLLMVAGLLSGCTNWKNIPQEVPPLTCWWMDAVQEQGADVQTASGVGLAQAEQALQGRTWPARDVVRDQPVSLTVQTLATWGQGERVLRELPASREVSSGVDGVPCLQGELVVDNADVGLLLDVGDIGPLRLEVQGARIEARSLDDDGLGLTLWAGWTTLGDLDPRWRAALAGAVPSDADPDFVRARLSAAGTVDAGAFVVHTTELDNWGQPTEQVEAMRVEWPAP